MTLLLLINCLKDFLKVNQNDEECVSACAEWEKIVGTSKVRERENFYNIYNISQLNLTMRVISYILLTFSS